MSYSFTLRAYLATLSGNKPVSCISLSRYLPFFLELVLPETGDEKKGQTGPDLTTLRTFRVLRPLKLVSGVPSENKHFFVCLFVCSMAPKVQILCAKKKKKTLSRMTQQHLEQSIMCADILSRITRQDLEQQSLPPLSFFAPQVSRLKPCPGSHKPTLNNHSLSFHKSPG